MSVLKRLWAGWQRYMFTPTEPLRLGVTRALFFGFAFLWYLPQQHQVWATTSTVFYNPLPGWGFTMPVLPFGALLTVSVVWKLCLLLSAVGLFTRPAMIGSFVLGTYLLGVSHGWQKSWNSDSWIVFIFAALALSRAGDAFSLDARRRGTPAAPSGEYRWPIRFVWILLSVILFAAGISKLKTHGFAWMAPDNFCTMLQIHGYDVGFNEAFLTSLCTPLGAMSWYCGLGSVITVFFETGFPLVLFNRWARMLLVPTAFVFLFQASVLMVHMIWPYLLMLLFFVPFDVLYERFWKREVGAK